MQLVILEIQSANFLRVEKGKTVVKLITTSAFNLKPWEWRTVRAKISGMRSLEGQHKC